MRSMVRSEGNPYLWNTGDGRRMCDLPSDRPASLLWEDI